MKDVPTVGGAIFKVARRSTSTSPGHQKSYKLVLVSDESLLTREVVVSKLLASCGLLESVGSWPRVKTSENQPAHV